MNSKQNNIINDILKKNNSIYFYYSDTTMAILSNKSNYDFNKIQELTYIVNDLSVNNIKYEVDIDKYIIKII